MFDGNVCIRVCQFGPEYLGNLVHGSKIGNIKVTSGASMKNVKATHKVSNNRKKNLLNLPLFTESIRDQCGNQAQ
jgi:hypothetical protein